MKKDLVIGIVGTLILLTAMVGVFRFEAAQRGAGFDVTWPVRQVEAVSREGGTNEGETTPDLVNLTVLNATRVEFILEWTDLPANSAPDEFQLVVTSPAGVKRNATGDGGTISVLFEGLAVVPTEIRLFGSDEAAARAQAQAQFTTRAAEGVWVVDVTLLRAGDVVTPPVPGAPAGTPIDDGGNDWTLRAVASVYEADLVAA